MPETEPGQEKVSAPADLLWWLSEKSRQQSPPLQSSVVMTEVDEETDSREQVNLIMFTTKLSNLDQPGPCPYNIFLFSNNVCNCRKLQVKPRNKYK